MDVDELDVGELDVGELLLLIRDYLAKNGILVEENQLGYETNIDGFVLFRVRQQELVRIVPVYVSEKKKVLVVILPDKIYDLCFILWDFSREKYDIVNMSCRKKENGLNSIILSFYKKASGVKTSLIQDLLKLAKRKE